MFNLPRQRPTITSRVLSGSSEYISARRPTEPRPEEPFEHCDGATASKFDRSSDPDERIKEAIQNALSNLEQEWVVLGDLCFVALGKELTVDFIALHPQKGVVLIDVAAVNNPAATSSFRLLLRSRGFEQDFPGYLPIVHLQLRSSDAPQLSAAHLEQALAAESPIGVTADGWIRELSRLLTQNLPRSQTDLPAAAAHSLERRGRRVALAIGFSTLLLMVTTALFLNGSPLDEGLLFERERTSASVRPSRSPANEPPSESPLPSQVAAATEPRPSTSTSTFSLHDSDSGDRGPKPAVPQAEATLDREMPDAGSNGAVAFPRGADPPGALPDGGKKSQAMDQSPKEPQLKASRPPAKGRVQLAAADTAIEAERVWAELQAAQVDVLGEVRVTVSRANLADGRVVYRLQTASMTAEDAQRLCETLRQRQVPCFVRR